MPASQNFENGNGRGPKAKRRAPNQADAVASADARRVDFKDKLSAAMEYRELGQRDLARKLGWDHKRVNYLATGAGKPTFTDGVDLAVALGVRLAYFADSRISPGELEAYLTVDDVFDDTPVTQVVVATPAQLPGEGWDAVARVIRVKGLTADEVLDRLIR